MAEWVGVHRDDPCPSTLGSFLRRSVTGATDRRVAHAEATFGDTRPYGGEAAHVRVDLHLGVGEKAATAPIGGTAFGRAAPLCGGPLRPDASTCPSCIMCT
jgi:hypothetical protein